MLGGESKSGIDCSAFVRAVVKKGMRIQLPRYSLLQAQHGRKIRKRHLKFGDIVFMDTMDKGRITHVAFYMGNNIIMHAASKGVAPGNLKWRHHVRNYRWSRRMMNY